MFASELMEMVRKEPEKYEKRYLRLLVGMLFPQRVKPFQLLL